MNTLRLLLASIGVVLFQWAFLQGLPLSQYGNPYIYVWVLMLLPQPMSRQRQFLIAFLLGSIMDSFEQSGGAHSLACLALISVKPSLENALLGFSKPEEDEGLAALPLGAFVTTAGVLVVWHHLVLFIMENYGLQHLDTVLIRTLFSSLITLLLLVILHALTARRYAKK